MPEASKAEKSERIFRGDRLKLLRDQMKLTQPEFERFLGFARGTISRYERGEIEPGTQQLAIMGRKLQVSINWLLNLTDNPEPDSGFKGNSPATPQTAKEAKFLERLRNGEVLELINELSSDAIASRNGEQKPPKDKSK